MNAIINVLVVLLLPRKILDLLNFAKAVLRAMTNNTYFPTPTPTLTQLGAAITALDAAEVVATTRAKGAAQARNTLKKALVVLLKQIREYVQSIIESQIGDALTIATSAGLTLAKKVVRDKANLAVKQGAVAGMVELIAKAVAKSATYYWEFSLDGKTWSSAPETMKATTSIAGLTVGQTYYFRFASLTRKTAKSDFSQIISFIVK